MRMTSRRQFVHSGIAQHVAAKGTPVTAVADDPMSLWYDELDLAWKQAPMALALSDCPLGSVESDLTSAALKLFVRPGVFSMPPFRPTEITDAEIDDIAAYLVESSR
jgi:hypothetical protein